MLLDVRDAGAEVAGVLAEIERLRRLDNKPDWGDFAVLGRTHGQLAGTRAFLELNGVPVRRAIKNGLPWPGRIREFRCLLSYLEGVEGPEVSVRGLRMRLETICGAKSLWTAMADRMLADVEGARGPHQCAVPDLIEAIHQALSDHARSHIVGTGVLVGTAHAAKGLEFRHVVVLGGEWQRQRMRGRRDSPEAQRRLYYVAMTPRP